MYSRIRMEMIVFKNRISAFIMETDIRILTFSPAIVFMIILFVWGFLSSKVLKMKEPLPITSIIIGVSFLLISLVGVIQIIRREVPGVFGKTARGSYAVFTGVLFLLIFGLGGLVAIYIGFQGMLIK